MADPDPRERPDELVDMHRAAALTGRHPETVRRWIWSGRIAARREGRRLLVARQDVEALAGDRDRTAPGLAAWAERARRARPDAGVTGARASAAELVIEDRAGRSG
jgi:excisionase family DNA binding protein